MHQTAACSALISYQSWLFSANTSELRFNLSPSLPAQVTSKRFPGRREGTVWVHRLGPKLQWLLFHVQLTADTTEWDKMLDIIFTFRKKSAKRSSHEQFFKRNTTQMGGIKQTFATFSAIQVEFPSPISLVSLWTKRLTIRRHLGSVLRGSAPHNAHVTSFWKRKVASIQKEPKKDKFVCISCKVGRMQPQIWDQISLCSDTSARTRGRFPGMGSGFGHVSDSQDWLFVHLQVSWPMICVKNQVSFIGKKSWREINYTTGRTRGINAQVDTPRQQSRVHPVHETINQLINPKTLPLLCASLFTFQNISCLPKPNLYVPNNIKSTEFIKIWIVAQSSWIG